MTRYLILCFILFACQSAGRTNASGDRNESSNYERTTPGESVPGMRIRVCSFNIKFVGFYKKKDHRAIADILKDYDLILIQELVSPPVDGVYPDGSGYLADPEAMDFVEAMVSHGFAYVISAEDTGTNDEIHSQSSSTEWFIAFYDTTVVSVDEELITDFLAEDRSNHPSFERVPHAFSFETVDGGLDFTLISVHLQPGSDSLERARRKEELAAIVQWIDDHDSIEKDFLIVGDMNICNQQELFSLLPPGFNSLNEDCIPTNLASEGRPYDHVFFHPGYSGEEVIDSLEIVDLVEAVRPFWKEAIPFPEHNLNLFYQFYSDHKPIVFTMVSDGSDDD